MRYKESENLKGIKELKARLNEDVEFKKKFCGLKDIDEMLDVARKEGYEVTMDEISCDQELTDDMLEAIAGGSRKDDKYNQITNVYIE